MEQLAYIRQSILCEGKGRGSKIADFTNGSGFNLTVNIDRGMDIVDASFKGIPLAWRSPSGYVAPEFYEANGLGWLRSWSGGLLTGCGLRNVGVPDCVGAETHGLHGRLSNIPAEDIVIEREWRNGLFVQSISGTVKQTAVFFENLHLRRKITSVMGENSYTVEDSITNHGFKSSPLMLLYHINLGYPLLSENTRIETLKHHVTPRDTVAAAGIDEWNIICPPRNAYQEQVFYHDIPADDDGFATVTLTNRDVGFAFQLKYRIAELPKFVQWKQMGQGEYVVGFEPANCYPEGQNSERARGTLKEIAPGETVNTMLKISVLEL
jgi:hypothetical protein